MCSCCPARPCVICQELMVLMACTRTVQQSWIASGLHLGKQSASHCRHGAPSFMGAECVICVGCANAVPQCGFFVSAERAFSM